MITAIERTTTLLDERDFIEADIAAASRRREAIEEALDRDRRQVRALEGEKDQIRARLDELYTARRDKDAEVEAIRFTLEAEPELSDAEGLKVAERFGRAIQEIKKRKAASGSTTIVTSR